MQICFHVMHAFNLYVSLSSISFGPLFYQLCAFSIGDLELLVCDFVVLCVFVCEYHFCMLIYSLNGSLSIPRDKLGFVMKNIFFCYLPLCHFLLSRSIFLSSLLSSSAYHFEI